jgi:hypothetical protein
MIHVSRSEKHQENTSGSPNREEPVFWWFSSPAIAGNSGGQWYKSWGFKQKGWVVFRGFCILAIKKREREFYLEREKMGIV